MNDCKEIKTTISILSIFIILGIVLWFTILARSCQPEIAAADTRQTKVFEISAYTSRRCETDDTPFFTSTGENVRPGIIAVGRKIMPNGAYTRKPFLQYGTKVKINGKVYEVQDIMNNRYQGYYLDIWMKSYREAIQFGRRKLKVEILGNKNRE